MLKPLASFTFRKYDGSGSSLYGDRETLTSGSTNVAITGSGKNSVWRGMKKQNTILGSQVMTNVAEDYAGLGLYNETGIGSVFRVLGAWFFLGAGSLLKNGVDTTADASTTLQIKKVTAGALGTTYQAGSAQPSAPIILAVTPPTGFTGKNNGTVSAQISRIRAATGGESNASLTSNVVTATNQSISITFPSADANGQDYWGVYVTKNAEGAIGNHYFLQEIPESVLAATVTASRVATNITSIGVANGTLTSTHIGWQYTSSGDVTTYVTAVGANDSYAAGKQAITLNVANGSTNTQSATFTRAVTGSTRTFVFEWRDSDLVGDLAPVRNYPPPAGIFGGASGDVVFVDGALGDTVDVTQYARDNSISSANTTTTTVGNAIAVSDPARPESFPPDKYIFTGDAPTAILQGGDGIHWRFARNSLGIIRYVSGTLSYERIWSGVGIQNQNQCVLGAGGRLYAYTGQRGLVRLGVNGEPDAEFAAPVHDDLASFTSSRVVLGYDANQQVLLVMSGSTLLAYYEPLGVWWAPLNGLGTMAIGDLIVSAVTYQGNCYISGGNNGFSALYIMNFGDFSTSGSDRTATAITPWVISEGVSDVISRVYVAMRADATGTLTVTTYASRPSYVATAQTATVTIGSSGDLSHSAVLKPNVRAARAFRIQLDFSPSTSAYDRAGFELIRVDGETSFIPQ